MARTFFRYLLAIAYFAAGAFHLLSPDGFVSITPGWVPWPETVIALTGVAEILGAIGLVLPKALVPWARQAAGIGLALYALCVWPANFNHALNDIPLSGRQLSWWYHGPRLAFQPVLIWWALWAGEVTNWPFRRTGKPKQNA
jgi:uncharacterized membrane protein